MATKLSWAGQFYCCKNSCTMAEKDVNCYVMQCCELRFNVSFTKLAYDLITSLTKEVMFSVALACLFVVFLSFLFVCYITQKL